MQFTRALTPAAPAYVTILTAAAAVGLLAMWPRAETETAFDARCEPWDSEAATALSGLIGNRNEIVEAQLGDALFRLRRARKYCRLGMPSLARLDYDSLSRARRRYDR
jgi:hypothetical protein